MSSWLYAFALCMQTKGRHYEGGRGAGSHIKNCVHLRVKKFKNKLTKIERINKNSKEWKLLENSLAI